MSQPDQPEQPDAVGSLAEEAAKLLGVLGDWAREQGTDLGAGVADVAGRAAETARDAGHHLDGLDTDLDADLDVSSEGCRWCPVCRAVHVVRHTSPEVREQLAVAATALLQAGTGILASFAASGRTPARRTGEVDRIDLDEHDHHGAGDDDDAVPDTDVWED